MELINKSALVAEIERRITEGEKVVKELPSSAIMGLIQAYKNTLSFVDTLEVKDPYEQCIQYASIESGIKAHAEVYSFNIESELFNQLTKEQQGLWRKEIEQACISGGEVGVELAKDPRYKENHEVKEVDLEEYINELSKQFPEVSFAKLSRIAVRVAKWQKEQFEKNRLAHCDALTEEQAQIESDFVIQHLKKNSRTPTFVDAIEYGMRLKEKEMQSTIELAEDHAYFAGRTKTIDEIKEALLSNVLPYFMHGGEADEVVAKLDEMLNQKK